MWSDHVFCTFLQYQNIVIKPSTCDPNVLCTVWRHLSALKQTTNDKQQNQNVGTSALHNAIDNFQYVSKRSNKKKKPNLWSNCCKVFHFSTRCRLTQYLSRVSLLHQTARKTNFYALDETLSNDKKEGGCQNIARFANCTWPIKECITTQLKNDNDYARPIKRKKIARI